MGIGSRIKLLLKEKGVTIKELSSLTGIPINTLYSITKRDTQDVRSDNLEKIGTALGVSVDFLLGKSDQELRSLHRKYESTTNHFNSEEAIKQRENYNRLFDAEEHLLKTLYDVGLAKKDYTDDLSAEMVPALGKVVTTFCETVVAAKKDTTGTNLSFPTTPNEDTTE